MSQQTLPRDADGNILDAPDAARLRRLRREQILIVYKCAANHRPAAVGHDGERLIIYPHHAEHADDIRQLLKQRPPAFDYTIDSLPGEIRFEDVGVDQDGVA